MDRKKENKHPIIHLVIAALLLNMIPSCVSKFITFNTFYIIILSLLCPTVIPRMWIERDKEIKCCNKTVISLEDPTHADTVCRVSIDLVHIRIVKETLINYTKLFCGDFRISML